MYKYSYVVMQLAYHIRFEPPIVIVIIHTYIDPIAPLLSHHFCAGLLHDLILSLILPGIIRSCGPPTFFWALSAGSKYVRTTLLPLPLLTDVAYETTCY